MADSNPDLHAERQHPDWYDAAADFAHPRYAFALRVGSGVAAVSGDDWTRVEETLMTMWVILHEGQSWNDARPAVYHSWLQAKRGPG